MLSSENCCDCLPRAFCVTLGDKKGFRKRGLQRGLVDGQGFMYMDLGRKGFRKSGLQRGMVSPVDGLSSGATL